MVDLVREGCPVPDGLAYPPIMLGTLTITPDLVFRASANPPPDRAGVAPFHPARRVDTGDQLDGR